METRALDDEVLTAQLAQTSQISGWATTFPLECTQDRWTHQGRLVVVENNDLRRRILGQYHDNFSAGHPGISRTYDTIKLDYWWPGLRDFVTQYV